MIPAMIQFFQIRMAGTQAARMLDWLGAARAARWWHDRQVVRRGLYSKTILGQPLSFAVRTQTEVMRIDAVVWEQAFIERILGVLEPGDTIYDVGANIGVISLVMASRMAERGGVRIEAFEPEARNAAQLRQNLALNNASQVTVHELALGETIGRMRFFLHGETGCGRHSLVAGDKERTTEVDVEVTTGDAMVERFGWGPDVLKIDVEGGEMAVLRGLAGLLGGRQARHVFVEVHPDRLAAAGEAPDAVEQWMVARGYELAWKQRRQLEIHQHYIRG